VTPLPASLVEQVRHAASAVRQHWNRTPDVAIVLGTGLGKLAEAIEKPTVIEYPEIPNFPVSTVESHAGRLLCGTLAGKNVVAMQGRFHRYEGYTLQQVTFPIRVLRELGATTLIVSNACGVVRPDWHAGELMLIADHINLLGDNPLIGPNDDRLGPRFPDMSAPYDEGLRAKAREVARRHNIALREGVYVAVPGPNLETRAEYRMVRELGADVVGMSSHRRDPRGDAGARNFDHLRLGRARNAPGHDARACDRGRERCGAIVDCVGARGRRGSLTHRLTTPIRTSTPSPTFPMAPPLTGA
jgi:purine-nucleoside phosphorylase